MRNLMWAALAAGAILVMSEAAWANDTVRLGGPAAHASVDGGTDTFLVHRRGGYGGGYYGRAYYGGYYGRSYYGGYYGRPFLSVGFYGRPYYAGYYRPYYYPSYYYQPNYYSNYYNYPCAGDVAPVMPSVASYQAPLAPVYSSARPANDDGTFHYDGNPRILVPMPSSKTTPAPGVLPVDGRLVSLPSETTGGVLPVGLPTAQRATSLPAPRVVYPAYGEEPIAPAPRKVSR